MLAPLACVLTTCARIGAPRRLLARVIPVALAIGVSGCARASLEPEDAGPSFEPVVDSGSAQDAGGKDSDSEPDPADAGDTDPTPADGDPQTTPDAGSPPPVDAGNTPPDPDDLTPSPDNPSQCPDEAPPLFELAACINPGLSCHYGPEYVCDCFVAGWTCKRD